MQQDTLGFHAMPGHLIRRLNQISVAQFFEAMNSAGLQLTPVQFAVLSAISNRAGIDQATVSGLVAHDRATVGKVIERLKDKGLIERSVSAYDRRAKVLNITPAGASLLARAEPAVTAIQSAILAGLDKQEQDQFIALLTKAATAGNALSRAPLRAAGSE